MIYRPVLTKRDFVARFLEGEFGNRTPTWTTLSEFESASEGDQFMLRSMVANGGNHAYLKRTEVINLWPKLHDPTMWYCSEMVPHHLGTIQGEVQQRDNEPGLSLFYGTGKKPMRDDLKESGQQVYGIIASLTLRQYMCPNSYEWLQELLKRYPGHVVEFTSFSVNVGTLPRHNTIFFEVRNY